MKYSKFSEEIIIKALKRVKDGEEISNVAMDLGVERTTIYNWCRKAGINTSFRINWEKVIKQIK